ncbi:cobalamin-independent methionine synthase II family protein [Devosia psychrophila]|jgi:5-methyltetrahydropteroyltriglutamate--homocysteine methyltransferase|uniref:5-methyltetrahydropteroyltriglutamate--homocysteine methyltransferase n=1 Tax=Devosia psychrophila TaxID=728005 RepID=A0A0F5PVE4_9HYPH|nr:cobalamin-independent methionine synthase II family protein [Devosia psychrophila]KKC31799.1 enterotoxin [Devosia psychrophila]SFC79007.1 5-methyltetrahydropteroyltriglutamate--homocysteine methyltransferase [Devosia psychrophila]
MTHKILTTHVGSLPRSKQVADLVFAKEAGVPIEEAGFNEIITAAVHDIVARQKAAGVDLPSDGEMSKISYATYIKDRLTGFDGDSSRQPPADLELFPSFLKRQANTGGTPTYRRPKCVGEITVKSLEPLREDVEAFQSALSAHGYAKGFMNSATPGVIALFQPNEFYATQDDYLEAVAEGMRVEYEGIVEAGFILQLDAPDLGLGRHMMYKDLDDDGFVVAAGRHIEVMNHALRNIDGSKVRMHVCWGNYEGPHVCDIALKKILPGLLKAKPRALLFEGANPRHAHEWVDWKNVDLPDDYVLIPGVIDSTSNFVEHPELIAQRLKNFVDIVGAERVIAGTDCGFSTFAGFGAVDSEIVWAKLGALSEGAEIASKAA